jgi:hypothetical protein
MDRRTDEAEYVLEVVYRMRQELPHTRNGSNPNAVEQIDKALVSIQKVTLLVKAA